MSRAKTQTTGYGRPLGHRTPPPQTPRARELLARSRGVKALEVVQGSRPAAPPRKRVWERMYNQIAENCEQCGRVIEPGAERFQDWVSGHLRRHVECHERAEGKR